MKHIQNKTMDNTSHCSRSNHMVLGLRNRRDCFLRYESISQDKSGWAIRYGRIKILDHLEKDFSGLRTCISFLLLCSLCSCVCSLVAAKEYASVSSWLDRSALQVACIHSLLKVSQGRHQDPGLLSGRSVKNPHPGPFWFLVNTSLLHLLKLKSSFPCGLAAGVTLSSQ